MGFQQGLSGLNAASKNLEVIGNNVANANTVGFKAGRAEFADLYANALLGSSKTPGIGVSINAISQQFNQGNITVTSNPLDVAINGDGFFRMSTNGVITFARNGQFQVDKSNYIVNASGAHLTGYPVDSTGKVVTSNPVNLQLSTADVSPNATTAAKIVGNLDSRTSSVITAAFDPNDSTTYHSATGLSVFDSLGNAHSIQTYFRRTAANTWDVYASENGTQIGTGAIGTLKFDSAGAIDTTATTLPFGPVTLTNTNGAAPTNFTVDFNGTTQFGSNFGITKIDQDGYTTGRLAGFTIGDDGVIVGRYTNGQTRPQGQVVLAGFANNQGLTPIGNNQWVETAASGQPLVGAPQSGTLGTLQSGAVEEANTDLTKELVDMIVAQRTYQANAQTIKTEDSLLQTLVTLR